MRVDSISTIAQRTNFEGNVILKNKISPTQNYLFGLHKGNLDAMIRPYPFDLLIEQSKSKKTIQISTNVENTRAYFVRKNKQNFEQIANYAIEEAKQKSDVYKLSVKVLEMLDTRNAVMLNIMTGNFKQARNREKEFAKMAINDFEAFKKLPKLSMRKLPLMYGNIV